MEFLKAEENKEIGEKVNLLLQTFDDHFASLKNTGVEIARQNVTNWRDTESTIPYMKGLLTCNAPCCAIILNELVQKSSDDVMVQLQYISLQLQVVMCVETFTAARNIAEKAHSTAKSLYLTRTNSSIIAGDRVSPEYRAYFRACIDCFTVCRYQGLKKEAEAYLDDARTAASQHGNEEDIYMTNICYADILYLTGQLNKAIDDILTPLKEKPMSDETKGLLLHKLGMCSRSAAQWGTAKQYMRQSIKLAQKIGDKIAEHDRITDLGNVFRSEGRIADALDYQSRHMNFAFGRGDLWGLTVACFNIGFSYYSINPQPDLERAMIFLSIKYLLASRTHNEILRGMALNNLGKGLVALGQHESAIKILKICVEVAKSTGNYPGEGMAYGNIGTAYRTLGQYSDALVYHDKYLNNALGRGDEGGVAIMQKELAIDYLLKGDLENAEKQVKNAIMTLESIRNVLGVEDSSRLANFDKNQAEAYNFLQVILVQRGKIEEALELSEFARGRAVTDIVRQRSLKEFDETSENTWLWNDYNLIKEQLQGSGTFSDFYARTADMLGSTFLVYSVVTERPAGKKPEKWLYIWVVKCKEDMAENDSRVNFRKIWLGNQKYQNKLIEDERFFTSLCRSFVIHRPESEHPLQAFRKAEQPLPPQEIIIEDIEDVLIDYPDLPAVSALMECLKKLNLSGKSEKQEVNEMPARGDGMRNANLPEATPVQADGEESQSTRQAMDRVAFRSSWETEGFEQMMVLYDICISPVANLLPRSDGTRVPKLIIIPHEFLFHVPFCALRSPEGYYLIERYIISYAPSLRTLRLLHLRLDELRISQGNRRLKVCALGDPKMAFLDIPEIAHSGKEAKLVQGVFGEENCLLLTRDDAKKSSVVSNLDKRDVIHLATHAFPDDPEESGSSKDGDYSMKGCVILAPSDDDCDGLLLAREIEKSSCTCQLITLSCCDTGLGKLTGDGVVGLYRAFFAAGTPGVVVTLWKIRDDITPLIMEKFYRLFLEKEDPAVALREALLSLLRDNRPPSQWAAFCFIGASKPRF